MRHIVIDDKAARLQLDEISWKTITTSSTLLGERIGEEGGNLGMVCVVGVGDKGG
jgi:hypothetical protein